MNPQSHEEHIQHIFDSYCKKILKAQVIDIYRKTKRQGEHEVTFTEMPVQDLAKLFVTDEYFTDEYFYDIFGEIIGITNTDLAEALNTLTADKRDIILMSFFFDMTDREIAERLNMARRTVAYQRMSSLQKLKQILESEE